MAITDYLAQHYLTASDTSKSSSKSKKRKRAAPETDVSNLTIADDDPAFPTSAAQNSDDEAPTIVGGDGAAVAAGKKPRFKAIGSRAQNDSSEADALIADAEAERRQRAEDEDEKPEVVDDGAARMASGAKAGLQSAAAVSADLKKRQREERRRLQETAGPSSGETVYRDASGRVVNVAAARAEARAKEDAKKREEEAKRVALRGAVQDEQAAARRKELEDAKDMGVARGANDVRMNQELKAVKRWNDPMAGQLQKDNQEVRVAIGGKENGKKLAREFKGGFEPNRYGIKPGWRWDGVDRSNGFERKWWTARNERGRKSRMEYKWEMDE